MSEISTKPYLLRALYEWCTDNGYTPYLAVAVDERTQVPRDFVKDGEIILNVSPMATNQFMIGNEWIEFQARFGGVARELAIPVDMVSAIYARENGHGMAFDVNKLSPPTPEAPIVPHAKHASSGKRSHLSAVTNLNSGAADLDLESSKAPEKASLKSSRKKRKRTEAILEKVLLSDKEPSLLNSVPPQENSADSQEGNVTKAETQPSLNPGDKKKPTLTIIK